MSEASIHLRVQQTRSAGRCCGRGTKDAAVQIIDIQSTTPNHLVAVVAHDGAERRVGLQVERHPSGGWRARALGRDGWSLRCRSIEAAILLEAAEMFDGPDVEPPPAAVAAAPVMLPPVWQALSYPLHLAG